VIVFEGSCDFLLLKQWFLTFQTASTPIPKDIGFATLRLLLCHQSKWLLLLLFVHLIIKRKHLALLPGTPLRTTAYELPQQVFQ